MSIATNAYNLQIAKQTARGIYPANPTHFYQMSGPGLSSKPTIDRLSIAAGRVWGANAKRVGYVECGGQPQVTAQSKGLGLLLYGALGAKGVAGGGDPYTHTFTPATTPYGFPYFTIWQYWDNEWHQFRDCQIAALDITCSVAQRWMLVQPTIVGLAKRKYVAAPTPATEETDNIHWLDAAGYHYILGDATNALHIALPTDLASAITALTAVKTAYNAHCAVSSGRHHKAADAVNVLAYGTPCADLPACITACTEIRTDSLAHYASETVHYFADTLNAMTHANPTDLPTVLTFLQEWIGATNSPGSFNRHCGAKAGTREFKLSITMNATPLQGEELVAYALHRKAGEITASEDVLVEHFKDINRVLYGDPDPVAGTEQSTEIQLGGLYVKFIEQASPEHSLALSIPQFDYDPEPLSAAAGNPGGDEVYATLGGEASGSGTLLTATLMNAQASY